jgi:hypothetical protein
MIRFFNTFQAGAGLTGIVSAQFVTSLYPAPGFRGIGIEPSAEGGAQARLGR